MTKKKQETMWYGCGECGHRPDPDGVLSTYNWAVYSNGPCPKCGSEMRLNFIMPNNELEYDKGN